jgi:hypothetical protein
MEHAPPAQQNLADLPLRCGLELFEEGHVTREQ